jgi:hypothetical protein
VVYAIVVAFVLYVNGVFTGEQSSLVNLAINIGFLIVIGVLFLISAVSFGRLNSVTDELSAFAARLQKEYKESNGKNLWTGYQDRKDAFENEELRTAFNKYRLRVKSLRTKRGIALPCDLEEYINENLLDRVGMNFFNSGISGTLTGLGILGTFLGLSMGLGSFSGDDIYTISDNVGPLLSGMKVAFHTSVYGIFFSLVFNVIYRSIMSDAYEKLEEFLCMFRQTAQPQAVKEDENSAAMVVYQAGMSNALKQILDLLKGNAAEQTAAVERIVDRFTEQMQTSLGADFRKLGGTLKAAGEAQAPLSARRRQIGVGGEDKDAPPEVQLPLPAIVRPMGGAAALIQDGHKDLQHLRVGLLQLIEHEYRMGIPTHSLEDGLVLVAHVSRRGTGETVDRVGLSECV